MLGLVVLTINLMGYPPDTTYLVYLLGVYTILSSFILFFTSIFQAFERLEYTAIVTLIERVILVLLVVFVLISGYGLMGIGYAYISSGVIGLTMSFLLF